jgi:23S rRNA (uracil1939-C5)-methyltransferase
MLIALYNSSVQLKIEKLVYGGDGLARLAADTNGPGKSAFIPFVLEGETVETKITEEKRSYVRARLDRVVEPAPGRIAPACPYFQRCGGCHYQHTSYSHQLKIKSAILKETLRRTAKIELPCELQIHPSSQWNYRNRTRLKIQTSPEFALGYYKFRSHELLPVEQCPISSPLINQAVTSVWREGLAGKVSAAVREIELFANSDDTSLLAEIYCAKETARAEARRIAGGLSGLLPNAQGVAVFEQLPENSFGDPRHLASTGAESLLYSTARFEYHVSAGSFFQVNRFLIDPLVDLVTQGVSGKVVLDLYAGVGLFSAILAQSFAQVIAVEASRGSFDDLRRNCGQKVKAVGATTEKYLAQALGLRPDFVVADPPRGGLGGNVARGLAKLGGPRITYVSCDPSTLARDLRSFVSLGYRIEGAHLIDLFPQTFHIESVFHLAR